jgi:polyhydroxybutyrate depolymerase
MSKPRQDDSSRVRRAFTIVLVSTLVAGCDAVIDPFDDDRITSQTIVTGGLIRYYEWVAPDGNAPRPVLLVFHGLGGNAGEIRRSSEMTEPANHAGYVVVYPQAANEANRGWSMGCERCTDGDVRGINDVAYVDAILDDLANRTPIDRSRIYATGFSMGGWFVYALACQRSGMVRAIAPVGGLMPRPVAGLCEHNDPTGALVMFGDNDQTQPYNGSPGEFGVFGADSSAIFWARANNCGVEGPDEEKTFGSTRVRVTVHTACDGGVTVERHRVIGLTHVWPSGSYDATREVLKFFGNYDSPLNRR